MTSDELRQLITSGEADSIESDHCVSRIGQFPERPDHKKTRTHSISELRDQSVFDYPPDAVRELLMNAVLHGD